MGLIIVGKLSDLADILETLDPSGSIEGGGCSVRLDDPPTAFSADGLRVAWRDDRWGETERDWFEGVGAGLVEVLDVLPGDWYPVAETPPTGMEPDAPRS